MAKKIVHQFDLNLNGEEAVDLVENHKPNRKRHTQHQIQELEAYFKNEPNPNDRERRMLGFDLGMEPQQVKNWFINKHIQMRTRRGHHENMELRAENARLVAENASHKEHLKNVSCLSCGGPLLVPREMSDVEHQLRAENVQLTEQILHLSATAAQYLGQPATSFENIPHSTAP